MTLALSSEQREARCRGRQHSVRTAERYYARRVSLANSAALALEVGENLVAVMAASTKVAREAILASVSVAIPAMPPPNPEVCRLCFWWVCPHHVCAYAWPRYHRPHMRIYHAMQCYSTIIALSPCYSTVLCAGVHMRRMRPWGCEQIGLQAASCNTLW